MYPKTFFEHDQPRPESGQCFVLMPFAEPFREVYEAIVEALEGPELNFDCTRADELFGGGHIIEDILRCIGTAEIIVADLTTRNPNVFYELGIAHMCKEVGKVLILTQDMEDVPFDVRQFRCIVYEQTPAGLRQLQDALVSTVREISRPVHRFEIETGQQYRLPHRLFGPDRCFHDFEIIEAWVEPEAVKLHVKEYRHALDMPVQTVKDDSYGISRGEHIDLTEVPWQIVLEEVREGKAHFRVVPKE